jgi:type II secretory ATPase GspE/PulE/Tfp pilus assembly ATPase PilB-like protein
VPFALPSGIGAEGANSTIVLVGKSFTNRVKDEGRDGESRSSGFNLTLALLGHAISKRATDIHIGAKDDQVALRLRVDGELVPLDPLPTELGLPVINVFKVLSDLSIADKRRSQDGSFRADVDGRRLCFRVASQGTNTGEKLSIRILDPAENFSTFAALGITDQMDKRLKGLLGRHNGLILFAGATGAGKSTTAYAALRYLNSGDRNIVTIEDPIEYSIPSIDQIEVKARTGQTFQDGLRSLLRQDADILLIGEIRDNESARVACQAATTGQLVLSTLHANDSVSAAFRLADLGVDPYMIASALRGVVSQQLIRKLCTQCRIAHRPSDEDLQRLGLADLQGELYHIPEPSANPCLNCNSRGYLGRTGIFELLEVTSPIRDLIRERAGDTAIAAAARENGMIPLWDDGRRLLREGIISPLDFQRIIDEA